MLPEAAIQIKKFLTGRGFPETVHAAVILGSGLGDFTNSIQNPQKISYQEIPHFPSSSVKGHSGILYAGSINGKNILAFSGRFHHYEGYAFDKTVLPVQIARAFNAEKLIISNAAGAINTSFSVGDLMVIDSVFRPFLSVSASGYSHTFRCNIEPAAKKVYQLAAEIKRPVQRGTYLYVKGPNYETPAEIRAFRIMGADVVGMSTVPEIEEACRLHLPVVAISLVTNMASGISQGALNHDEVKSAAESRKEDFANLVTAIITSENI